MKINRHIKTNRKMVKVNPVTIVWRIWVRVLEGNDVPSGYVGFWGFLETSGRRDPVSMWSTALKSGDIELGVISILIKGSQPWLHIRIICGTFEKYSCLGHSTLPPLSFKNSFPVNITCSQDWMPSL